MSKFLTGLMSVYMIIVWILSGLIHLWTVYIGYQIGGVFWGGVAFFFPVISEIYLGFQSWSLAGFDNAYLQWLIVVLVMWILQYVFAAFVGMIEEKQNKNTNY